MAVYSDKVNDSFLTKIKIFLFIKAFDENILEYIKNMKKESSKMKEEFKNFSLTLDIAYVYSDLATLIHTKNA